MLTSNLVALIFVPLLALYCLLLLLNRVNEEQPLRRLSKESLLPLIANLIRIGAAPAAGLFLGLLLSAFFWLPALSEGTLVNQDQWYGGYYRPELHFVYPNQLFAPDWGFGISQPGPDDAQQGALSFQIGAAPLALAILSLIGLRAAAFGTASRADAALAVAAFGGFSHVADLRMGLAAHRLCQLRPVPLALADDRRAAAGRAGG